jgi:hypothetical protein
MFLRLLHSCGRRSKLASWVVPANGISSCSPDLVVLTKTASASVNRQNRQQTPEPKGSRERIVFDKKTVTLRTVADRVKLAPCSVSAVLNNTPASWAIPQRTKDRVFRAAAQLNYRPNFSARSLRTKRTHMVAVMSADFGRAPVARVVAGMERILRRRGYLLILGAFDAASQWDRVSVELQQRGIEGVISVGVTLPREVQFPVVSVNLGPANLQEPLSGDVSAWLTELGESAAQAVVRDIETKSSPRKTEIVPKRPPAFLDLTTFDLPAAALALQGEIRDAS